MKPRIKPFPKDLNEACTLGLFNPLTNEIYLGCDEKQTISTLWHEEFHRILLRMFDNDISRKIDNFMIKPIKKDSLAHELQDWFFGKEKDYTNYPTKIKILKEIQNIKKEY